MSEPAQETGIEFLEHPAEGSDALIVAFTGVAQKLGGVPFEFYKSLTSMRCSALFVRDLGRRWYQYDADLAGAITARIADAKAAAGVRKVVCLGNSMGGFGALYFGARSGADAIIAFSPQTAIDPAVTRTLGDMRWEKYQRAISFYPFGDLARVPPPVGAVSVCYGDSEPRDVAHVAHLRRHWRFREIVAQGGHDAARVLRDEGALTPLIESVLRSLA